MKSKGRGPAGPTSASTPNQPPEVTWYGNAAWVGSFGWYPPKTTVIGGERKQISIRIPQPFPSLDSKEPHLGVFRSSGFPGQPTKNKTIKPPTPTPPQHPHWSPFPGNFCDVPTTLLCAWGLSTGTLTASRRFVGK